ncbi:MAG: DUF2156 domain-containing protein [Desulfovibrionaceae bacterium]|nr:DUF2156 domain-containing protein [Desulfovibrionaceae bacterium]
MEFTPIRLTEKTQHAAAWALTPCHSIDYTLINLFGWQKYFDLSWGQEKTLLWIRQSPDLFWAPLGDWEAADWDLELSLLPSPLELIRVPEALVTILTERIPERIQVKETRGQWEYLYAKTDLATLAGRNFHKKKNLCNSFVKAYGEPDYRPISDNIVEDVLALEDEWCQWHECEGSKSLQAENTAINLVLSHWSDFSGLLGGALYIDDRIAAFSIGEPLDATSIGVHYEKGLLGFKGIYQTINREFAIHCPDTVQILNRAQDLDEEGLRAAKTSYNPCGYLKKYAVTIQ